MLCVRSLFGRQRNGRRRAGSRGFRSLRKSSPNSLSPISTRNFTSSSATCRLLARMHRLIFKSAAIASPPTSRPVHITTSRPRYPATRVDRRPQLIHASTGALISHRGWTKQFVYLQKISRTPTSYMGGFNSVRTRLLLAS